MLCAVAMIGISFGASAQTEDDPDCTITVKWDAPDAVKIKLQGNFIDLPQGATETILTAKKSSWASAMIYASPGFVLDKCIYEKDGASKEIRKNANGYFSVSVVNFDGLIFNVTTQKVVKNDNFTLNIVNGASKIGNVRLATTDESVLAGLHNGENTVAFDSRFDKQIYIEEMTGTSIFSVKRNGTAVTKSAWNKYYTVSIEPGDNIEVRVFEGEEPVDTERTVTVEYKNSAMQAVRNIFNKTRLKTCTVSDNKFTCESGDLIQVNFNADYDVNSVTFGGANVEVTDGQSQTFTVVDNATLVIDATEKTYVPMSFTAYIVCPEGIDLYAGNLIDGEKIELGEGESVSSEIVLSASEIDGAYTIPAGKARKFTFDVSSKYARVMVMEKQGYWIRTTRIADKSTYASNPIESTTFYIVAEAVENDSQALVYLAGDPERVRLIAAGSHGGVTVHTLTKGYNEVEFDHDYEAPFKINCGEAISNMLVTLNGTALKADENEQFSGIALEDGSVLKIFADGKAHKQNDVTFTSVGEASGMVVYDRQSMYFDFSSPLKCYDGTEIKIYPGEMVEVYLDGEILPMGEDGTCTFYTQPKNHKVTFRHSKEALAFYQLTPEPGDSESINPILVSFPVASTAVRSDMADDEILFKANDNSWAASSVAITAVENYGMPTFELRFTPEPNRQGAYTLYIPEGFFTIEGDVASPEIMAGFNFKKQGGASLEYTPEPMGQIIAQDWLNVAFIFDESLSISLGSDIKSKMSVSLDGEELPASAYGVYGEGSYFMISVEDQTYCNRAGQFKVAVEEGAFTLSGTPSPALDHTWTIIMPKEYSFTLTPSGDETVSNLANITLSFDNAETAEIFNEYGVSLRENNYASGAYSKMPAISAVEHAEVPTFEFAFDPAPTSTGTYILDIYEGTFTLDGAQGSPSIKVTYNFDKESGVSGITVENGGSSKDAIYNFQGIRMNADWEDLPAGLYIRNGEKVIKK